MSLITYSLDSLPTEPLVLVLSRLIAVDLVRLKLVCSALRAQLDHLGVYERVTEQRDTGLFQCTFCMRRWPQLGIEQLTMVGCVDIHRHGLFKIVTNYAGESCMVMSIVDGAYCRYLYINSGMAKYMISTGVADWSDIWILGSVEPLGAQEYIAEWLNYKYHGSQRFITMGHLGGIRRAILDIWDTRWGGCQHIFAPEVVHLLTSW